MMSMRSTGDRGCACVKKAATGNTLEAYLHAYRAGASIADEPKGLLFRKVQRDWHHRLSEKWWHAGERGDDGQSRFDTDHADVRSSPVSTSVSTRSNASISDPPLTVPPKEPI